MTDIQKRLLWLVLLIAALIIVSALSWQGQNGGGGLGYLKGGAYKAPPLPPPPYTQAVADKLAKSHGFQVLISYTDNGFEPANVTIKKGDTVRFTNNSTDKMNMKILSPGSVGDTQYPGAASCGGSALNSCDDIALQDFWEFTFTSVGSWTYQDSLHPDNKGTITVTAK